MPARSQALDTRAEQARAAVESARARLTASQAERRGIEKDLAAVQGRLSKFKDQLMEVKTNREYTAMLKEIETAQAEVGSFEDRLLERMLQQDELSAAVTAAERSLAAEEKEVAAERATLERERAELEEGLERTVGARRELEAQIDPSALATFEAVARSRRGVALAEARDGICTICHVRLRPQVFNEVRRNAGIIRCDSCQRILYFVPPRTGGVERGASAEA